MEHVGSTITFVLALGAFLSPVSLGAQQGPQNMYTECAKIPDDQERLACFDRTYAAVTKVMGERLQASQQTKVDDFGLSDKQIVSGSSVLLRPQQLARLPASSVHRRPPLLLL